MTADGRIFYVTTPIYYVNDRPHLGHAYTSIAADAIARWHRLKGEEAWMLTGTDEHGQKVYESATKRGLTPQAHVDELHAHFKALLERVNVAHDDFIRTTQPRHVRVVQEILQALHDQGDIYAADYEGWYSKSEERFWTEKDLVDGRCPISGNPVEWIKERNYFFRMSKYADRLREWVETHPDFIQPESRRNEVLGYLKKDVGDLCISRPKARLPWGIELPFDRDYVAYVWFDALINYISAAGYRVDPALREPRFERLWPASFHIVGKDILTTHSVYWSTMLFALGLEPARTLYAHGWWTVEGRKMSKSLGNVIDPHLLVDAYGADAVRYFLLREIPFGGDGDFSHNAFLTRYNADLANDLGNLAHRSLSMTAKWLDGRIGALDAPTERDRELEALAADVAGRFEQAIESLQFSRALEALWELVRAGNKYIDSEEPWRLNREGKAERLAGVMRRSLEVCRVAAMHLWPVCPAKAEELAEKLGLEGITLDRARSLDGLAAGTAVRPGKPLFPRMTELPAAVREALAAALGDEAPADAAAARTARKAGGKAAKDAGKAAGAKKKKVEADDQPARISYDDFAKVALRAGRIVAAEAHPKADRLLVLKVDVGEAEPRTIVAGIAAAFRPEELVGRQVVVVVNLKPVKLRGIRSEGMLLAAGGAEVKALATLDAPVEPGTIIR